MFQLILFKSLRIPISSIPLGQPTQRALNVGVWAFASMAERFIYEHLQLSMKIQQECGSQSVLAPGLYCTCCEWNSERSESHRGSVSPRPRRGWQRSAGKSRASWHKVILLIRSHKKSHIVNTVVYSAIFIFNFSLILSNNPHWLEEPL